MAYRYNPFSGRLTPASLRAAYIPQGFKENVQVPVQFQFDSSKTKPVVESVSTNALGGVLAEAKGLVPTHPRYKRVMELQSKWLVDDGLLVWQKRGMRDKVPMYLTLGLVGVTLCIGFSTLWTMSWPRKVET